jgi:ubiquinone/menaquinone biosynthesis C-methylase UbiE
MPPKPDPGPEPKTKPEPSIARVPYVTTPPEVVQKMLEMAKVKAGDVVIDLGCGDGRIVITAVDKFKATKGIGLDIDPIRVKESNDNAAKAKVTDKVSFTVGDVLKLTEKDLAEATVITMYLLPDYNLKLMPLLKKLKPGTRIVSHDFDMGKEWDPDAKAEFDVDGVDHSVFVWTVK